MSDPQFSVLIKYQSLKNSLSDVCLFSAGFISKEIKTILAHIFHTDSAAACEHLMDTASVSNCSSGSMKHTAVVRTLVFVDSLAPARLALLGLPAKSQGSLPRGLLDRRWCLHQDSRRLATNQYEICGLNPSPAHLEYYKIATKLAQGRTHELEEKIKKREAHLQSVYKSLSWRVTKPLRSLGNMISTMIR